MAPPFLACVTDAIPFRKCPFAESTGIHDNKGKQPLRPPLPEVCLRTPFPETGRGDGLVIGNLQPDFTWARARWEEISLLLGQRALLGRVTRCPLRLRFNLGRLAAGKRRSTARRSRKRKSKGKGQMAKGKSEKPHAQKSFCKKREFTSLQCRARPFRTLRHFFLEPAGGLVAPGFTGCGKTP